jgi:hypothetical protein
MEVLVVALMIISIILQIISILQNRPKRKR